jgi:hypothetical protein
MHRNPTTPLFHPGVSPAIEKNLMSANVITTIIHVNTTTACGHAGTHSEVESETNYLGERKYSAHEHYTSSI